MKHEYRHGEAEHAIQLRERADGTLEVRLEGSEQPLEVRATRLGEGRWLLRTGHEVREVTVERRGASGLVVRMPDGEVALERLDPFRARGPVGARAVGPRPVVSPIPGRVVDVLVELGDDVTQGQPLVVLEAMKMANELRSPIAGRVTRLHAVKGQPVEGGVTLAVVEAT